ncbi:MAG: YnfA family protein [Vulcanococcus sp.]
MVMLRTFGLFTVTAVAEILGCYLPYLVLRGGRSPWLLLPAALALGLFAWLLTLHPQASGRIYAAYGAVYVSVALIWLRLADGVTLSLRDLAGIAAMLAGMALLMARPD